MSKKYFNSGYFIWDTDFCFTVLSYVNRKTVLVIMATNMSMDKNILMCKKCGLEHERPVGSKCERGKSIKDKKRDTCKETTVQKTPRGKGTDMSSHEKILETVMSTMTNFTEKLNSMEERLSGLTSRLDTPATAHKSASRKSRSCEKVKRIEISDDDDKTPVTTGLATVSEDRTIYSQTFPDVAVAIKPTPARPKKLKVDTDLGAAPLLKADQVNLPGIKSLPRVTSTVSRPQPSASVSWDAPAHVNFLQTTVMEKPLVRDVNFNLPAYSDQYGNSVQIQSLSETGGVQLQNVYVPAKEASVTTTDQAVYVPVHETLPVAGGMTMASTATLEALKANPFIQQLVKERVAVLESRMKSELQQGSTQRKKSGRYNVADPPCGASHLRWPNESCPVGINRKRALYDDLTLGQFVVSFLANVLGTPHQDTCRNMIHELMETVKLAENLSWPIARGAFAVSMQKLEDETLAWSDKRTLVDHRLTYSQSTVFSGSVTLSPKPTQQPPPMGKRVVCKWYNEGSCPHQQDRTDTTGLTTFRHICMYCFRQLKWNNVHTEIECNNKRKATD